MILGSGDDILGWLMWHLPTLARFQLASLIPVGLWIRRDACRTLDRPLVEIQVKYFTATLTATALNYRERWRTLANGKVGQTYTARTLANGGERWRTAFGGLENH